MAKADLPAAKLREEEPEDVTVLGTPPGLSAPSDPGLATGAWPPVGSVTPADATRLGGSTDSDLTMAATPGMGTHHAGLSPPPFPATPRPPGTPAPGGPVKTLGGLTGFQGPTSGQPFGPRYHLVRLLGTGGMGAVYQAWDQELGVVVAIKVIRPEAMEDPEAARELERRFKRELLLARNVTHKNVVRIHDLGEVEGVKYITMPYVHGEDLGSVLKREHKLPLSRALSIAKQIASGLVAAHDAGVVHRDLKPANILLDNDDHALITDFGIARSTTGTAGGTVVGTVVGTLDYMAPEQARGHTVDHRADIYAFGLILSDMLIGRRKTGHGGESSLAALMNRMTTAAPPVRSVDPNVPQTVSDVVSRCTALEPEGRYAKTRELLADLESLDSHGHPTDGSTPTTTHAWTQTMPAPVSAPTVTAPAPVPSVPRARRLAPLFVAGVALLLVGAGAILFRNGLLPGRGASTVATRSVAIAVLPFRNTSGDRSLDALGQTIAEQLRTQIGNSDALRAVSSSQVAQILSDLQLSPENLDPTRTSQIASSLSADVVISGQYATFGNQIQITANVQDLPRDQTTPVQESAANQTLLLPTIGKLAAAIREKLVLPPGALKALEASAFAPSSKSLRALEQYNLGQTNLREGKVLEAVKAFEASIQEDRDFALAYARLAQAYAALGFSSDAERHARTAFDLSAGLQDAEKFMVQAAHARVMKNREEAVAYQQKLAALLPGSDEVLSDLGAALEENSEFDKAHDEYAKLRERDANNIDALMGLGRTEVKRGQARAAIEPLSKALNVSIERNNAEATATAREWIGVVHRILNRPDEALNEFKLALEIARRLDRKRLIAEITLEIGKVQANLGKLDVALKHYEESLALRKQINDQQGIGDTLIDFGNLYAGTGQFDRALVAFKDALRIQREQRNVNYEGMLLSNIGATHFLRGEHQEALTYYEQALAVGQKIKNPGYTADAIYNIGETHVRLGQYAKAESSFLDALKLRRDGKDERGEAQVHSSLAKLFGYQGRFDAALTSAKQAYDTVQRTPEKSDWTVVQTVEYGNALGNLGQVDEGRKVLESALALARNLGIDALVAEVLNHQGDLFYRNGQYAAARPLYEQALQLSTKANDTSRIVLSRVHLALTAAQEGRGAGATADLRQIASEADRWGFKPESVSASIAAGAALLAAKRTAAAQQELETALLASERTGLRVQRAQSHYWLSQAFTAAGDAGRARQHLQSAQRLLDELKREAKTDAIAKRADLAPIAAAK